MAPTIAGGNTCVVLASAGRMQRPKSSWPRYFIHADLNRSFLYDTIWAASTNLDTVAMLPQLWMMTRIGGEVERGDRDIFQGCRDMLTRLPTRNRAALERKTLVESLQDTLKDLVVNVCEAALKDMKSVQKKMFALQDMVKKLQDSVSKSKKPFQSIPLPCFRFRLGHMRPVIKRIRKVKHARIM